MTASADSVKEIVQLNGGALTGKTRLQKTVYFLEIENVGFGFDFEYYHYGPYSEDLAIAADDAVALGEIKRSTKIGASGQAYAVFHAKEGSTKVDEISSRRRRLLEVLARYDSISLELAATADFLGRSGYSDPWAETKNRKPTKAQKDRIEKAKALLKDIGLQAY